MSSMKLFNHRCVVHVQLLEISVGLVTTVTVGVNGSVASATRTGFVRRGPPENPLQFGDKAIRVVATMPFRKTCVVQIFRLLAASFFRS